MMDERGKVKSGPFGKKKQVKRYRLKGILLTNVLLSSGAISKSHIKQCPFLLWKWVSFKESALHSKWEWWCRKVWV